MGGSAICALRTAALTGGRGLPPVPAVPTLLADGLAVTVTAPEDGSSTRGQVMRRQADGTWRWVIDQPASGTITALLREPTDALNRGTRPNTLEEEP